jgi:peptide/nickel transport system substrate-binding protein
MRRRWLLSLLLLVLFITPLSSAFRIAAQAQGSVLRYPIGVDPEHLNPFTGTTIAISTILNNVYESLVGFDPKTNEIVPSLAETWTVSPDGLIYTFKLRKGVLFQQVEGVTYKDREFKARDWLWAGKLSLNKDEKISSHTDWLEGVVGAADFKEGKAEAVKGVVAPDDYTIQITLEQPNRRFLYTLGVPAVSQEAYEQLGEKFTTTPVGTGPFQFVEWKRDSYIQLKANPDYWQKGLPKVDGVRFINVPEASTAALQYRQNDLDFLFALPVGQRAALVKEFSADYNEKPGLNVRYFGFKMDKGFFVEHPLVRKALAHAFNRELVWNDLMEGARFPATLGVLPPSMPASTPASIYEYNLEKAAKYLEEAGFPKGEGLPELKLYIFASAKSELSYQVFQEDLRQLGVNLNVILEDDATYWTHIEEEDVVFFMSGWSAGTPDPSDVFNFLFLDAKDTTKYNNPKVNDLLRAALRETDDAARAKLYQEAHDLITADTPWVVSAYSKVAWLQKPWIEGFVPGGGGTYTARLAEVSINPAKKP